MRQKPPGTTSSRTHAACISSWHGVGEFGGNLESEILLAELLQAVPMEPHSMKQMLRADAPGDCSKTVPKPLELWQLGLALSEKQNPQMVENNESRK